MIEKEEYVVLVDSLDQEISYMEKLEAHRKGLLHRAISVCLFDDQGYWLLQKRAETKYHSPNHIANSCCSHPFLGEMTHTAAIRRVEEELCMTLDPHRIVSLGSFIYKEEVGMGLIEHEFDHLFGAIISRDEVQDPNPAEVQDLLWMSEEEITEELQKGNSSLFLWAKWFPPLFYTVQNLRKRIL